ncbi:hypothetical protein BDZ91DRAFT_746833 [Kalaharituber pfeilii]|nr:hypothetical protein BDZ91DRAFT_746833 [Kalaharituber pfeilii]
MLILLPTSLSRLNTMTKTLKMQWSSILRMTLREFSSELGDRIPRLCLPLRTFGSLSFFHLPLFLYCQNFAQMSPQRKENEVKTLKIC